MAVLECVHSIARVRRPDMAKYYSISCKEVGYLDCAYSTTGDSIEQVIELCADHGRQYHELKGFGAELYAKMRPHIRLREEAEEPRPQPFSPK